MSRPPTLEEVFAVMSAVSTGDAAARVSLPADPDLDDLPTRFAVGLNILLDDLAHRLDERTRLEDRLRQAYKMEAVGNLAGGIAHDFNNILSVILGFTDLAVSSLGPQDPLRPDLVEVMRAAERARDLTAQLLAFSRRQLRVPKVLDLNQVLRGMERMLRRLLHESVELTLQVEPQVDKIKIDRSQLEQVVLNLAVNASDAMPHGGRLSINTATLQLDDDYVAEHQEVRPGRYVMMRVSDTGMGMPSTVQARLFEPFFTTKEDGKGTGLGLATVYGIVKQNGGHIEVASAPGRGATFEIYLPACAENAEPEVSSSATRPTRGAGTVLLVEDDAQTRGVVRAILARNGYTVLEAQNTGDALLIGEQYSSTIHLLLTDVVMPRMSGKTLAERLLSQRPRLKVMYMSGYPREALLQHDVLESDVCFVKKPVMPNDLLAQVDAVLNRD